MDDVFFPLQVDEHWNRAPGYSGSLGYFFFWDAILPISMGIISYSFIRIPSLTNQ